MTQEALQQQLTRIDQKLDALGAKLDDYAQTTARQGADIEWLKESNKGIVKLSVVSLLSAVAYFLKSFIFKS